MKLLLVLISLFGFSTTVQAQQVTDCVTENGQNFLDSTRAIVEPWEENTRTFSNGKVRLIYVDTDEPVYASAHLIILSPPYDEIGSRQCKIVSTQNGLGFASLTLDGMIVDYDPAIGLAFEITVGQYNFEAETVSKAILTVVVNQATGLVTAAFE